MKIKNILYGISVGIINSAFGSGGGLVGVRAMRKNGLDQKSAQATTLAVILPLTVISVIIYSIRDDFSISQALPYIPFGFIGAVLGVRLMEKANNHILKKIFALFMIYAGIRAVLR